MKIVFLDAATLGEGLTFEKFSKYGDVCLFDDTAPEEYESHLASAEAVMINKFHITEEVLRFAPKLKLICLAATGYDNVDLDACRKHGVAVCNVVGYSTDCVAQLTVSMALSLITHLTEYRETVNSGEYTKRGIANCLSPLFHEIAGKTWGIIGYGNIGKRVAAIAEALGCKILIYTRTKRENLPCVDLDTICKQADILSLHTPLNDSTRGLLDKTHIGMLKREAIVINVARGAVTDEAALAEAVLEGKIGGFGADVYAKEPFPIDHPYQKLLGLPNVCLTPHMAWGAVETRTRLLHEMAENIRAFQNGETRSRVDLIG